MRTWYTLIVPALDRTGPVNVAADIAAAAHAAGWKVSVLYLNAGGQRNDLTDVAEVRQFRLSDLWTLRGVVHTHCLRPDLLGFPLSWNRRITLITTVHNFFLFDVGFDKPRPYVNMAWQLWKRALRRFDAVVCISDAMRRYYHRSLPGQPMHLAYNFRGAAPAEAADPALIRWIEARRKHGGAVLCFVGSLSERKNVRALVEAMAATPKLSLVLCGQGPLKEELETTVRLRKLEDRVCFAGQVRSPAMITRHTDALVLPSFAEGFPLAVIEAAAVGIPTLMSNITVHRELARLGFGRTFDHLRFVDFEHAAMTLRREAPAPSVALIDLWRKQFTPEAGFKQYENLLSHVIAPR